MEIHLRNKFYGRFRRLNPISPHLNASYHILQQSFLVTALQTQLGQRKTNLHKKKPRLVKQYSSLSRAYAETLQTPTVSHFILKTAFQKKRGEH
jgi:hypothetical protein